MLYRLALFSVIALLAAATASAVALLWLDRQRDKEWNTDRVAAANATKAAIDGLVLDRAASDLTSVENAAFLLNAANAELARADGHAEDRQRLDRHIEEFRQALDALVDLDDERDAARARAAWGALADDGDAIFELTGVRIDVAAAQTKVDAFLDERARRVLRSQLTAHREQIEGMLAQYEKQRAEFDSQRIGERTMVGFLFDDTLSAIYGAARDSKALAESMRAAGAPTPAVSNRVERMAAALDELAAAYGRVQNLDGVCVPFTFFPTECQDIGELPAIKRMIVEANAAHRRLANERRAWTAEVEQQLAA
jgi:hypothetical protein